MTKYANRNQKRYSVGDMSRISGLSIPSIRFYDEKKILVPAYRDEQSHYRYYSEEQILTALSIRELRLRGISVKEMADILEAESLHTLNDILTQKRKVIEKKILELEKSKQLVETSRQILSRVLMNRGQTVADDQIFLAELPVYNCLYSDSVSRISVDEIFWDRFAELYQLLDEYGYKRTHPIMAVFHEHYTHQFFFDNGQLEVFIPVEEYDTSNPNMKQFGGFLTAGIVTTGHYNQMLPYYTKLVRWIEENQYEIIGDPIEIYVVEFTHTPNSNEYVTEIRFPVKKSN
ncbi:MerR family transcriptional regulator [Paenibacillus aquistagni]|uniref:MerR family transcriptional regulator n=1 Tax=Paenibacillus aquistagni TaxID=1852522 RepID=UPI00145AD63B|nr:MerR family transcriptional regulator [Paenibacillus aquistagni]NMM51806.1 MerR family transcriptional regulator [Paenibacillus aquistagni]